MRTPFLLGGLLALATFGAVPAQACSVVSGYKVPTNFELAERADTIVIATVESLRKGELSSLSTATLRPTLLLKGAALPAPIQITGFPPEGGRQVTRSNPRELRAPNPDALMGGCTRYLFEPGMKIVLFMSRDKSGQLQFMDYPFARVSEDVPSDDAPRVKAVRIYVEIAALPKGARRTAMVAKRDALRATTGDPDAALLADDIDRELAGARMPPFD